MALLLKVCLKDRQQHLGVRYQCSLSAPPARLELWNQNLHVEKKKKNLHVVFNIFFGV